MSVETILTKTMKDVPKAIAAGVVDMSTGMLLGVKTVDSHPQEVLDCCPPRPRTCSRATT